MGIGDWGLGMGDWRLGPTPNPQSPIPNPQSPIPNYKRRIKLLNLNYLFFKHFIKKIKINIINNFLLYTLISYI